MAGSRRASEDAPERHEEIAATPSVRRDGGGEIKARLSIGTPTVPSDPRAPPHARCRR